MTAKQIEALAEAKRRWQATEFNYAKNPINTMKVRRDKALAEYNKLKAKHEGA